MSQKTDVTENRCHGKPMSQKTDITEIVCEMIHRFLSKTDVTENRCHRKPMSRKFIVQRKLNFM